MASTIIVDIPTVSIKGLGKYWLVNAIETSVHGVKVVFDAPSPFV